MSGSLWKGVTVTAACLLLISTGWTGAAFGDKDQRNVGAPSESVAPVAPAPTVTNIAGIDAAVDRLQQSGRLATLAVDWIGLKSFYAAGAPALWVTSTGYSPLGLQLIHQVPKAALAGMPVSAEIQSALANLPPQISPALPADVEALMSAIYVAGAYDAI